MTITRIDAEARWSDVVIHNQTLYYTGVPSNLDADACAQTADTLAQIDAGQQQVAYSGCDDFPCRRRRFCSDEPGLGCMGRRRSCPGTLYGTGEADESEIQSRD